jgi:ATP-dependent protease ClpP protease subunit
MLQNKRKRYNDYDFSALKKHKPETPAIPNKEDIESSLTSILSDSSGKKSEKIQRFDNHVYFYSEVDREAIFELNMLLREAEEENILTGHKLSLTEPIPIYLHINSYGGSIFAGFDAVDYITSCKVPVYTIIEGCAASAATLMSVVGKKRFIRPNAYMLVHQLSSGCWGKMNEIEDDFINLQELTKNIKSIYEKHTKIPKKEMNEILKHDLWWRPDKCLSLGLVDELYEKL